MANTCSSSSNGVNWWFECSALDDDLIYVGGTAKFTITMKTDPAGSSIPEKKVWLDSLDGDLSFSPQTPSFDHDGASAEITVTGVKPSSAEGTTYIQLRIQSADGPICEVLPMTVFEGVIIKFSGTFYSPIDNQQPGGSWGIGPAPCEWGPPKNIAPTNLVYFQEPPSKRPWTPSVSVAITSVMAKKPAISLDGDPLMSQPVDLDTTTFREPNPDNAREDILVGFKAKLGPLIGNAIMTGAVPEPPIDIFLIPPPAGKPDGADIAYFRAQTDALVQPTSDSCYKDLSDRLKADPNFGAATLLYIRGLWISRRLQMALGPAGASSKAAKAFVQKQGSGASSMTLKMKAYNWITLVGDVEESVFETPD